MKHILSIILLLCFCHLSHAQSPKARFETRNFDFGTLSYWDNNAAVFRVTNTGKADLLFLPTFGQRDITIRFPQNRIAPGATDSILVYLRVDKSGLLTREFSIYSNESGKPINLSISGIIKALPGESATACPDFNSASANARRLQPTPYIFYPNNPSTPYIPEPEEPILQEPTVAEPRIPEVIPGPDLIPMVDPLANLPDYENGLLSEAKFKANHIVFLVDVSGSMRKASKLDNMKSAMKSLISCLRHIDRITIITYSGTSSVIVSAMPASEKETLSDIIESLKAGGGTYAGAALNNAYKVLEKNFIPDGNNQVILATDGIFNQPGMTDEDIHRIAAGKADQEMFISVVGFGNDPYADLNMAALADAGRGKYLKVKKDEDPAILLREEIKARSARYNSPLRGLNSAATD